MMDPSQQRAAMWVAAAALLGTGSSFWMLARIAGRLRRGQAVLPRQPRQPVPWGLGEVLLIAAGYVGLWVAAHMADRAVFGPLPSPAAVSAVAAPKGASAPTGTGRAHAGSGQTAGAGEPRPGRGDVDHRLIRLLRQRPHWATLLEALVVAAVIAPVVEEFLFRLVLQGYLESVESKLRRYLGFSPRAEGALAVLLASVFFAALHYREAEPPVHAEALVREFRCQAAASVATLLYGLIFLRGLSGATLEDLGIRRRMIGSDVRLGLGAFLIVAAPMYGMQIALALILPALVSKAIAPDPITLALFALVLGTLYCRTHRIVPSITLHMALNATSVLLAWMTVPLVEA